jgi:hypothetical protein
LQALAFALFASVSFIHGRLVFASQSFLDMVRWTPQQLTDRSWLEVLLPDPHERAIALSEVLPLYDSGGVLRHSITSEVNGPLFRIQLAWLHEHLADVELEVGGRRESIGRRAFRPWGYSRKEALLPEEPLEHPGFRLLRELLVLSAKIAFFEIAGPATTTGADGRATLRLRCNVAPPVSTQVDADAVRTNCVPVANVFEATGDPSPSSSSGQLVRPGGTPRVWGGLAVREVTAACPTDA